MNSCIRLAIFSCIIGSSALLMENAQAGGADVGNGGNSIRCRASTENSYRGLYALDFLLTESPRALKVYPATSWMESRERILGFLKIVHPQMALSFSDFVSQLENHTDYESDRIWEESSNDLNYLNDQKIISKLPGNCTGKDGTEVSQTVIRRRKGAHTTYHYAPDLIEELKRRPLQYSFLMVHEWLWDFTDDVFAIRQFNRLLHSEKLASISAESFSAVIGNLRIRVPLPIIDLGLYAPRSGSQGNTEGDFSRCTIIPWIQAKPNTLLLGGSSGSSSCWNIIRVNSLSYTCKVSSSSNEPQSRIVCTIDRDQFDLIGPNPKYDVETIEIINPRHLLLTFVPGEKRKQKVQIHYDYTDYQFPRP